MTASDVYNVAGAVLLSVTTAGGLIGALSSWLGKVWANRILEKDRQRFAEMLEASKAQFERVTRQMQANLDHAVFVSRAQFEVELTALRKIWRAATLVRARLVDVRLSSHSEPVDATPESRLEQFELHRKRFVEAHSQLVRAIDHNSAFYPRDIYNALDRLRGRTTLEREQLYVETPFTAAWYDHGDAAFADVVALTEKVSDCIRSRMEKLVIRGDWPDVAPH